MNEEGFKSEEEKKNKLKQEVITLGSLVVFKTHPYAITESILPEHSLLIQDAQNSDSPIMVVAELIKHLKNVYDENSSEQKIVQGGEDCKCIWYNPKSGNYEETWISDRQLSVVSLAKKEMNDSEFKINEIVYLKSLPLEKNKLSMTFEKSVNQNSLDTYRIKGLHTFEPPLMQIIDTKKNIIENRYDAKWGIQKKYASEKNVKCKWFNTTLNKFSEIWLPINVLKIRENYSHKRIDEIYNYIQNKKLLRTERYLLSPKNITSDGFRCHISGHDIISNAPANIEIEENIEVLDNDKYLILFKNCTELWGDEKNKKDEKDEPKKVIHDFILKARNENFAIRIVYKI